MAQDGWGYSDADRQQAGQGPIGFWGLENVLSMFGVGSGGSVDDAAAKAERAVYDSLYREAGKSLNNPIVQKAVAYGLAIGLTTVVGPASVAALGPLYAAIGTTTAAAGTFTAAASIPAVGQVLSEGLKALSAEAKAELAKIGEDAKTAMLASLVRMTKTGSDPRGVSPPPVPPPRAVPAPAPAPSPEPVRMSAIYAPAEGAVIRKIGAGAAQKAPDPLNDAEWAGIVERAKNAEVNMLTAAAQRSAHARWSYLRESGQSVGPAPPTPAGDAAWSAIVKTAQETERALLAGSQARADFARFQFLVEQGKK